MAFLFKAYTTITNLKKLRRNQIMKSIIPVLLIMAVLSIFSSCTATIYSGKTAPPELDLPQPNITVVFVNYFDYTTP